MWRHKKRLLKPNRKSDISTEVRHFITFSQELVLNKLRLLKCYRIDFKFADFMQPKDVKSLCFWWITEVWIVNMPTTNYAMALLMPRPLLLSTSICLMDHGGLDRGPFLLPTIHTLCHTHWMCFNSKSVLLYTLHLLFCPSWRGMKVSSLFSPWKFFLGVFPDPMWGQRSGMSIWQIVKPSEAHLICEHGRYKINRIVFMHRFPIKEQVVVANDGPDLRTFARQCRRITPPPTHKPRPFHNR